MAGIEIAVAAADTPEEPYKDALGEALIDSVYNANQMDPDVVDDDDDQLCFF